MRAGTYTLKIFLRNISLIKTMFPNALIVIDKFHLIELISRALNKTRIKLMKKDKDNYTPEELAKKILRNKNYFNRKNRSI